MYRPPTEDTGNPETQTATDQKKKKQKTKKPFSRKSLVLDQERETWQDRKLLDINC